MSTLQETASIHSYSFFCVWRFLYFVQLLKTQSLHPWKMQQQHYQRLDEYNGKLPVLLKFALYGWRKKQGRCLILEDKHVSVNGAESWLLVDVWKLLFRLQSGIFGICSLYLLLLVYFFFFFRQDAKRSQVAFYAVINVRISSETFHGSWRWIQMNCCGFSGIHVKRQKKVLECIKWIRIEGSGEQQTRPNFFI